MAVAWVAALLLLGALATGCSSSTSGTTGPSPTLLETAGLTPAVPAPVRSATPTPPQPSPPVRFDSGRAVRHVRVLAGRIGPRLATGPAFRRAAAYVAERLEHAGYDVALQPFGVPAGNSWGVPVRAGRSANVVATPPGFARSRPYLLVGAHLDTVAAAPGAEDNASGVAVLLELARLIAEEGSRLPVVLVAFGAEEPRGDGDDLHHFGSRQHVHGLTGAARRNLRAMVSLDRVGVGARVPVCTGGLGPLRVRDELLAVAGRLRIPAVACADNRASDHWSYEKAGFEVARLGSTPYAAYHSAGDTPDVVEPGQLGRTGRLIWAWLRAS